MFYHGLGIAATKYESTIHIWAKYFLINFLKIYGCSGSSLLHVGLLQLCQAGGYALVGLYSVLVLHGLSCYVARGIFRDQGLNL